MKTPFLAFMLYALTSMSIQSLHVAADDDASSRQVVLDTNGKILRAGVKYYILPATPIIKCTPHGRCWSHDAGFSLAGIDKFCPLDVVAVDKYRSLPVTFLPVDLKTKGVIRVYTDLNIEFSAGSNNKCSESLLWRLDRFDATTKNWFVTTSGKLGESGWKIGEYEGAYTLVYCPSGCKYYCRPLCKKVGVFVDEKGNNRVALTDSPYKVKFQKA